MGVEKDCGDKGVGAALISLKNVTNFYIIRIRYSLSIVFLNSLSLHLRFIQCTCICSMEIPVRISMDNTSFNDTNYRIMGEIIHIRP